MYLPIKPQYLLPLSGARISDEVGSIRQSRCLGYTVRVERHDHKPVRNQRSSVCGPYALKHRYVRHRIVKVRSGVPLYLLMRGKHRDAPLAVPVLDAIDTATSGLPILRLSQADDIQILPW